MKMKKLLACVCAGVMALSLATPAFAAAMTNPTETEFTGAAAPTTVSVRVLAATKKLYVNPYGMSYALEAGQVKAGASLAAGDFVIEEAPTSAGFFSDTAAIQNNGANALGVKVTLKSESVSGSTVVVVATEPSGAVSDNTLFGNFEIADATATTGTVGSVDNVITITPNWTGSKKVVIPAAAAASAGTATTTDTQYTLKGATSVTDLDNNTVTTPGYAAFRLTGEAYVGTSGSWAAGDLVNVTVAFSFVPAAAVVAP